MNRPFTSRDWSGRSMQDAILGFFRLSRSNRDVALTFYREHGAPFGKGDVAACLWIEYGQYTTPN